MIMIPEKLYSYNEKVSNILCAHFTYITRTLTSMLNYYGVQAPTFDNTISKHHNAHSGQQGWNIIIISTTIHSYITISSFVRIVIMYKHQYTFSGMSQLYIYCSRHTEMSSKKINRANISLGTPDCKYLFNNFADLIWVNFLCWPFYIRLNETSFYARNY